MERRQFLSWVSVGMLATSLPMVLAACGADTTADKPSPEDSPEAPPEPTIDTTPREDGFQALATVEQVNAEPVVDKTNTPAYVMIFRHPDTEDLVALNPMCTHQGCTVKLDPDAKTLPCPCHGSVFALDGSVTTGPAESPLPLFEVKEEEGLVLVKVST